MIPRGWVRPSLPRSTGAVFAWSGPPGRVKFGIGMGASNVDLVIDNASLTQ
jgi:hypothetical protein